ncbi:isochorismatase family protein [Yinghuangia soli]|uniref:Isochorismatase family protein n=1 Tax=Yinghuangia soli TaxID=2908204 RepID=A0AA41PXZ6_9ACTN|nr:isochorismatase family protein [Yinghuangia soli]MCF2527948.1 isochorismatase family protein [Yinghuangia soli]
MGALESIGGIGPADTAGLYGSPTEIVYDRAGFGAAAGVGVRPAVVVVDLTRGFTEDGFPTGTDLTDVVAATTELIDAARFAGAPVVFTAISYTAAEADGDAVAWLRKAPGLRSLREGSAAVALDPRLPREDGDHLVLKKGASAFFGTSLAALLSGLGCDTAVLCGATTSGCVRATAVDAVQSGFAVMLPAECAGDRARGPHDAALFDIQAKYGDVVGLDQAVAYLRSIGGRPDGPAGAGSRRASGAARPIAGARQRGGAR